MNASPDRKQFMDELGIILEDYAEWYNHVIRSVFYAKDLNEADVPSKPDSFMNWMDRAKQQSFLDVSLIEMLIALDAEISDAAKSFLKNAEDLKSPSLEAFDDFRHIYEDFYTRVRRIERDSQLSDSGLDAETGLRSMSVFERDLKREMERLARSSNPFCLAAVRIDHIDDNTDETILSDVAKKASEGVLACLRTFDDAYRKGSDQFILCLKNTDYPGANAAINRINRYYRNENMAFSYGDSEKQLSISCAIAEVLPTDNADELVENLMKDVEKNAEEPGTVLQFQELSQLQRFVKKIDD